jgi:hypothetical protein
MVRLGFLAFFVERAGLGQSQSFFLKAAQLNSTKESRTNIKKSGLFTAQK